MCDADPMDPKPNDSTVASDIAAEFLRERVRVVRPIGQGSNNKNFLVETANGRAVVKLSHEHRRHRAHRHGADPDDDRRYRLVPAGRAAVDG